MVKDKKVIHIHMAEDEESDRDLFKRAMEEVRIGNKLTFSVDGEDLMNYLHRKGPYSATVDPLPDLILLDLKMPHMDGHKALQLIRSAPALKHIPVLILTTSEAKDDIKASYNEGANGYITKPVSLEGMARALDSISNYWIDIVKLPKQEPSREPPITLT